MWKIPDSSVIIITVMGMLAHSAGQSGAADTFGVDFEELKTQNGEVFVNVTVKRIESSALLIQHRDGMARVSLFELSPSIQERYQFDPIAAMKADLTREAEEKERLAALLLEKRRRQDDLETARAESELIQVARTEWVPVEATIIGIDDGGVIVEARSITLVSTQVRSTLGFLNEGPPKRVLEPFGRGPLLLDEVVSSARSDNLKVGDVWRGYLNPIPEKDHSNPKYGNSPYPAHQGVARTP